MNQKQSLCLKTQPHLSLEVTYSAWFYTASVPGKYCFLYPFSQQTEGVGNFFLHYGQSGQLRHNKTEPIPSRSECSYCSLGS